MAKYTREDIAQGQMMTIYLDEQFDSNSPEYLIKEFVNDHVELASFDAHYNNDSSGRKAKHPKDMLAGIIYGYYKGIHPSRKLEEAFQRNIAFKYMTNNMQTDHSIICAFKITFQKEITQIFSKILYLLHEMKLIDWERVVGDGTSVASQACKELSVKKVTFRKKMRTIKRLSKKIVERSIDNEKSYKAREIDKTTYQDESLRIERQKIKYKNILDKLEAYEEELDAGAIDGTKSYNLTDPESSVLIKNRGRSAVQGYNAKMMISNNDIILSVDASSTHERNSTASMIQGVEDVKKN